MIITSQRWLFSFLLLTVIGKMIKSPFLVFPGCHYESYIIFSARATSYMHSFCKWCDIKCHTSSTWFFWGHIDIWGETFLFNWTLIQQVIMEFISTLFVIIASMFNRHVYGVAIYIYIYIYLYISILLVCLFIMIG